MSDYGYNLEAYRQAVQNVEDSPRLNARDALLTVLTEIPKPAIMLFHEAQLIADRGVSAEDLQNALLELEQEGFVGLDDLQPYLIPLEIDI